MIRVLLADDHAMIRVGLKRILDAAEGMRVLGEAASGEAIVEKLSATPVDVVLLDISMPGPGMVETMRRIRAARPGVKVLVLSMHSEEQYAVRCLRAGAHGYLSKERSPEELVEAIRTVNVGGRYANPAVLERLRSPRRRGEAKLPHDMLSAREFEVFRMLAGGTSIKDIAERLSLSPKTVSTFRARILRKMGLHSNADMVRYAIAQGLEP